MSLTATNPYGYDTETKNNYITVTSGGENDYFPSSYEILNGTYVSGAVADLSASDDSYLLIQAEKLGGKNATYMVYTIDTDLTSLSSLTITLESHPTVAPQRQRVRVWDYTSGNWSGDVGDDTLNSTSDQTTVTPVPDPADYIDPATGEVKLRVRTGDKTRDAWDHYIDMVKITAAP